MEGTSANTPEPALQNHSSEQKEKDKETFEIKAGPVQLKGTERFILTLFMGLLGGGVILYLLLFFQLINKKPLFPKVSIVQTAFSETQTAQPTASPLPTQTAIMETVVIPETVEREITTTPLPTQTAIMETVIITRTQIIEREITTTPLPTPTPKTQEVILRDGVPQAFKCGAYAVKHLSGWNLSDDKMKSRIRDYWRNEDDEGIDGKKCGEMWVSDDNSDQFFTVLVDLIKNLKNISSIEWDAAIYSDSNYSSKKTVYLFEQFSTELTISGEIKCPSPTVTNQFTNTVQILSTPQDIKITINEPIEFTVKNMRVEVQEKYDRVVMYTWIPKDDILQMLREKCP